MFPRAAAIILLPEPVGAFRATYLYPLQSAPKRLITAAFCPGRYVSFGQYLSSNASFIFNIDLKPPSFHGIFYILIATPCIFQYYLNIRMIIRHNTQGTYFRRS